MQRLKCDKPYNVDEARKKKGLPRRKREDPRTTAYELAIRVPEEYQELFGKKKISRTVYALNQRTDLKQQIIDFENDANGQLDRLVLAARPGFSSDHALNMARMPFGMYVDQYRERRSHGAITKDTMVSEATFARYVRATLNDIPLEDLTAFDVEQCIIAIPRLSEEWAIERRQEWERRRETGLWKGKGIPKPLAPIKVAGPDAQYKVLKFIKEVLNDAIDREYILVNVAKKRFLAREFKKSRPLIDPLMEDDAKRFLECVCKLSLSSIKVAALVLFSTGMRPEELLALRPGDFVFADDPLADSEVHIVGALKEGIIVPYAKTDHSIRSGPIDPLTAYIVKQWIEYKRVLLAELGLVMRDSTPLLGESTEPWRYNPFLLEWKRFTKKNGFQGMRPYALRHTFATLNLKKGENIKTISYLLGHADASYTLDLYVGYIPSSTHGLASRYMGSIAPDLMKLPEAA